MCRRAGEGVRRAAVRTGRGGDGKQDGSEKNTARTTVAPPPSAWGVESGSSTHFCFRHDRLRRSALPHFNVRPK
jgi:hypothetical protein